MWMYVNVVRISIWTHEELVVLDGDTSLQVLNASRTQDIIPEKKRIGN